jgi:enoyl-CoA hydratase/carnithine racemase
VSDRHAEPAEPDTDRPLQVRTAGASRVLVLNLPHKRNALDDPLLADLCGALEDARADDAIRSIVLRGAGSCFSSGRDQKDAGGDGASRVVLQDDSLERTVGIFTRALELLIDSPKPTVAAVHGYALAGGQALTLACDFVVAERGSRFGNPEIRFGFPAAMNTVLLARHIGRRRALEIAVTGRTYLAEEYLDLGLVNRLAEPGRLDGELDAFTTSLNEIAPWAMRRTKQLFRAVEASGMDASLHAGDSLNQLLRANAQLQSVFEAPELARERLQRDMGGGTRE